jgi:RimJ/RimL family protein N-acetyltransferase
MLHETGNAFMKSYVCLTENCLREGDYAIVPVQPEHIESIRQWRNTQLDALRQPEPISEQQQVNYYATHIWPSMMELTPTTILLSYLYQDQPIGYGGLVHIAWHELRAEVSFLLATERAAVPEIYAEDFHYFLGLLKHLAFDGLSFNRIYTETYDIRQLHIQILEASGFVKEGVMRQHVRINGCFVDSIIHGFLKND